MDPAPRAENIKRVAAGGADVCITSVAHYLTARSETETLPARFAAVIGQRHTIGAVVREHSPLETRDDLSGCRLGGNPGNSLVESLVCALAWAGLAPPTLVPVDDPPASALSQDAVDAVSATVDTLRRTQRQAGVPVRAIPVGADAYMSGLVASDRLPADVVAQVKGAVLDALEQQRLAPAEGLSAMRKRYPEVDAEDAREGWVAVQDYIFSGRWPVGAMTAEGWEQTLRFTTTAHNLPSPPPETVYRPEFLVSP